MYIHHSPFPSPHPPPHIPIPIYPLPLPYPYIPLTTIYMQLPEQYRMDPPSREPKPHHRKRKHKHKSLDRTEDSSDIGPPPTQAKLPSDAYNFIRQEPPTSGLHAPPSHSLTNPMVVQSKVITGPGHLPYQPTMGASEGDAITQCHVFDHNYSLAYGDPYIGP